MTLGWAIVSTGRHPDQKMAPAINATDDARIAAVVSRSKARAREFADKHSGANAYDDYAAMLRDPAVDVVYLASPNHLHTQQAVEAAAAGKHVLCEKPMALTIDDCNRIVDACAAANVRLGVGFHLRNHPGHERLRDLVAAGSLGTISLAQANWVRGVRGQSAPPLRPPDQQWWEDPAMAGAGVMMATGVHCVDLLRFVLGREVTEVSALTDAAADAPLEHLITLLLRFEGGAVGTVITSRRTPDWPSQDVAVYGSLGKGIVSGSVETVLQGNLSVTTDAMDEQQHFGPGAIALYARQVEAFCRAVAEGTDPPASGLDGLRSAQVTLAMVESARTGRRIELAS